MLGKEFHLLKGLFRLSHLYLSLRTRSNIVFCFCFFVRQFRPERTKIVLDFTCIDAPPPKPRLSVSSPWKCLFLPSIFETALLGKTKSLLLPFQPNLSFLSPPLTRTIIHVLSLHKVPIINLRPFKYGLFSHDLICTIYQVLYCKSNQSLCHRFDIDLGVKKKIFLPTGQWIQRKAKAVSKNKVDFRLGCIQRPLVS